MGRAAVGWVIALAVSFSSVCPASGQNNLPAGFDVVSIKPIAEPGGRTYSVRFTADRFTATNVTPFGLILRAFGLRPEVVVNLPPWADAAHFDVEAVAGQAVSRPEMLAMLRDLLARRFGLVSHWEERATAGYALQQLATANEKLKRASPECVEDQRRVAEARSTGNTARPRAGCGPASRREGEDVIVGLGPIAMNGLATMVSSWLGRPIKDETGLAGEFDVQLRVRAESLFLFTPQLPGNAPRDQSSIFTGVEQQLGLTLQPARLPVRFLVIDRIERPSEN